ncbi:MAG: hypothetical protein M1834_005389 [Cirrosporium novae-zelandiae]|nr:MAG: hypothetical protein M1834_005389 [Cirrosporium novae-zelandiae]
MSKNKKVTDFFKPQSASEATPRSSQNLGPNAHFLTRTPTGPKDISLGPSLPKSSTSAIYPTPPNGTTTSNLPHLDAIHTSAPLQGSSQETPKSAGSGQRVLKNGIIVIKSSDDEEDSLSDSSLEDLDVILSREIPNFNQSKYKENGSGTGVTPARQATQPKVVIRTSERRRASPSPLPPVTKYKFSINSLVANTEMKAETESEVAKAKAKLEMLKKANDKCYMDALDELSKLDDKDNLLSSIIDDENEEDKSKHMDKVMNAISRTEAFHHEKSWSFFRSSEDGRHIKAPDFPSEAVSDKRLDILKGRNPCSRRYAFLSGLPIEPIISKILPDEIILWMLDLISIEPRKDLRRSYVNTLEAADRTPLILSPTKIRSLFELIGARSEAVDTSKPTNPTEQLETDKLLALLELLCKVSTRLTQDSKDYVALIISRLALDSFLMKNPRTCRAIESSMATFLDYDDEQGLDVSLIRLGEKIFETVQDSHLRQRLLQNMPLLTTASIELRARLSLSFFFNDASYLGKPASNSEYIEKITTKLQTSHKSINRQTDYSELAAIACILDIAIAAVPQPSKLSDFTAIRVFNEKVDALAQAVRDISAKIMNSGASAMTRTEAKQSLEDLEHFLLQTVRTQPPPRKTVYGEFRYDDEQAARQAIKRFLGGPQAST